VEVRRFGVRVVLVEPGAVRTVVTVLRGGQPILEHDLG
jgi:NAD(P)-dependent dehydrogenase (short-subunit alcohol dehydrogenase family)